MQVASSKISLNFSIEERKIAMDILLWFLLFENIFFLVAVFAFFYLRQRAYTVIAVIILAALLFTDIVAFQGHHNWFIVVLPSFICVVIGLIVRPFLPRPRITLGHQMARILLFVLAFLTLFLFIIGAIAIVFSIR